MTIRELEEYSPGKWFYDMKDQLKDFVYNRSDEAFTAGDAARDEVRTVQELEARNKYMREKFVESLGGLPDSDTPLNSRITGVINCDGYRIEKVIFESRPEVFVTANLYIPDGITSPRGAVLFVCGHHMQAKHADEYQVVCQYLVRAGLVVLAQDPIGQGERLSYYEEAVRGTIINWGSYEHDYAGNQCWLLGDCIARYFAHDAMRGVDYLCSRPEVDPKKIGVTGNSGGGTQTCLMMMCDTRIAAAAPGTFLVNRKEFMYSGIAQDAEQIWPGMTALGFDHEDMLMAMVPRPVLVLAVTADYFPIESTRRSVARTKRFWDMYGKGDSIGIFEDVSDHSYTRPMAKAAAEFFSLHLLGKKVSPDGTDIKPMEQQLLWCTKSGQIKGDNADARIVYDENQDRLAELEKRRNSSANPAEYRARALKWLEQKVFYNRRICDLNIRKIVTQQINELNVQNYIWWSQERIFNSALIFRDYRFNDRKLPAVIAVWDGGTSSIQPHIEWIRSTCAFGKAVVVLDVSGTGNITPESYNGHHQLELYGVIFKLTHDLMWLDDSIAAMRTYDVTRCIDAVGLIPGIDAADIGLHVHGRHGLYALLAAALDRRVKSIETEGEIESFTELVKNRYYDTYNIMSVIIPGVLKYFDTHDIRKWIDIE